MDGWCAFDHDGTGGGWAFQADELDEGNYINYGLDVYPYDTANEFDQTPSSRPRSRVSDDDEAGQADETDDRQYDW